MKRWQQAVVWGFVCAVIGAVMPPRAAAHPWHRHRPEPTAAAAEPSAVTDAEPVPAAPRFVLTAAPRRSSRGEVDIGEAFAPFVKTKAIAIRRDDRWFYVESDGMPAHPLMVGIRNWQQQVPLPQKYLGDNAWQIPLRPVPAREPISTKNRFLRGAIALAVNGIPIFNPLNNRGEDAFAIGELDDYGGHCGRADDYHYHIAPLHLEKTVGKGMPIAYGLDGYPVYGATEPDGSPMRPLDECGGHEDGDGGYHYHAITKYPYLIGAFRGEVTEREGQVDPQPRAEPVRPALPPLQGARIVGFESPGSETRRVVYEVGGRKGSVEYTVAKDGSAEFTFTDPSGQRTTESYTPRRRGGGGGGGRPGGGGPGIRGPGGGPPGRGPQPPPPRPGQPAGGPPQSSQQGARRLGQEQASGAEQGTGQKLSERSLVVTSPAFGPGEPMPVEFSCDGAGISPPVEWQAGPPGTTSYALTLWHRTPDGVKSYWVVYDIPATARGIPKGSRAVGTLGLNGKQRAEYDPMCSKGPGRKDYHITVYALSARPQVRPGGATREAVLEAISTIVLAEGTLTYTFERKGG